MNFICAHCGAWVLIEADFLDSGTTLTCNECGKVTIVDLFRPEERAKLYGYGTKQD
jgi:DNA-directed RNA polymerase subunit RPC12/RpoP